MTEYETMIYQRKGKIGYIMFNRPQSLNAVNDQFEQDLQDALLEFDIDEEAWVAIVHGTGRCFCAGADIKQRFVEMTPLQQARRTRGTSSEGYLGRTINWKPVIAAVHGYALGAGTDEVEDLTASWILEHAVDREVSTTRVRFGIDEAHLGGMATVEDADVLAEGRHLADRILGVDDQNDAIGGADRDRLVEERLDLLWAGGRRDVVVVRRDAAQPVAHAAAREESLVACLVQCVGDAGRGRAVGVLLHEFTRP